MQKVLRALAMVLFIGVLIGLVYGLDLLGRPDYDDKLNLAFVGTKDDADCILLWQRDFAMMIDTGEAQDGENILAFLAANDIEQLDYLVLTHPDKDHIGSASTITHSIRVKNVIQPYYQKENDANRDLQARLAQDQVKVVTPSRVLHYTVNDLEIYVYPPQEKNYGSDNNYSLAVLVEHRNVSLLFPGDAEDKRLEELTVNDWEPVDLYKLPHHGRYSDNSAKLLTELQPKYSVVTAKAVSKELQRIGDEQGTQWFYTVGKTVTFISDGETLQPVTPSR